MLAVAVVSREIARAQIIDWWSDERTRVSAELKERFPLLLMLVDKAIDEMPLQAHVKRGKYRKEELEPLALEWVQSEHDRFGEEFRESAARSMAAVEGDEAWPSWSTEELAKVGTAAAFSVAPLAALPFLGGLIVTTGLIFPTASLAVIPATIVVAGMVALGYGPTVRKRAAESLRERFRTSVHKDLRLRILGNPENPEVASLMGTLLAEVDGLRELRLRALEND